MRLRTALGREDGVSLVELLVVMMLMAIIGGFVLSSVVRGMQAASRSENRVEAVTDLQRAAENIAREIRAADPILVAEAGRLQLDIYRSGGRRRLDYVVAAGGAGLDATISTYATATATTPTSTATVPVIAPLAQPAATFTYARADGATWTTADGVAAISRVNITLVRTLPDETPLTVTTAVHLRNHEVS